MDKERLNELMTWLAAQIAAAKSGDGMVHCSALYEQLKAAFPEAPMTIEEMSAALVKLTAGDGVAVELADDKPGA